MKKSRISAFKQGKLIELFVAETTARKSVEIVSVNRNTAKLYFHKLRLLIKAHNEAVSLEFLGGKIEIDESYFGGKRKGKRGRGAAGKVPVFGLLKRGGKVFAQVVSDTKSKTLIPIIKKKICPQSILYTDTYPSYNSLSAAGFRHYRINHSKEFSNKSKHINGLENFWNQAKRHLRKFNGIPKENFHLYLHECQWKFNNPSTKIQLKMLRKMARKNLF